MTKDDDYIASIIACREMLDAQPVPARVQYMGEDDDDDTQVYKKPWVGLTDEEIGDAYVAWDDTDGASFADFARAIEQLLKTKNT